MIFKRTVDTQSWNSETHLYLDGDEVSYDEWMKATVHLDSNSFQRTEADGLITNTWTD